MAQQYRATQPLFIGRARAANPGDILPGLDKDTITAHGWEDAVEPFDPDAPVKDPADMTLDELHTYADEQEIDLTGATLKADVLARVTGA